MIERTLVANWRAFAFRAATPRFAAAAFRHGPNAGTCPLAERCHSMRLREWTDGEQREIERLQMKCDRARTWGLECSHTDEGDPWCIIHDIENETVLLHIARIQREYVIAFPVTGEVRKRRTMESAVNLALYKLQVLRFTTAA